ncbi:kinase-like domain-containing protein [Butyriboletus roseoflavus]|nr:kinase-like domain-containing protein [Butyriboletus roseoflavus]
MSSCSLLFTSFSQSNVLIKDNGKACLSDFGLSRIFMEATGSSYLTSTVRGSVRWAAPELFDVGEDHQKEPVHVSPDPQSDIYSFGSTMHQVRYVLVCDDAMMMCHARSMRWQVLTGKVPYHYYKNDAQVLVALSRGLRPARPDESPIHDVHWEFMQRCWSSKNIRPSVEEVVDFLSVARTRCSKN